MPQVGQTRGNTTNWSASTTYLVETRHDCRSWNGTIAVDNKEKRVALHVIDTPMHGRLSSYQASSHRVQCCNLTSRRAFIVRDVSYLSLPLFFLLRPDRGAEYCDERLPVCVSFSVRDHIFGTTRPIFTKCFVHVTYGRGSVLL